MKRFTDTFQGPCPPWRPKSESLVDKRIAALNVEMSCGFYFQAARAPPLATFLKVRQGFLPSLPRLHTVKMQPAHHCIYTPDLEHEDFTPSVPRHDLSNLFNYSARQSPSSAAQLLVPDRSIPVPTPTLTFQHLLLWTRTA